MLKLFQWEIPLISKTSFQCASLILRYGQPQALMHITTKERIYESFETLSSFCLNRLAWLWLPWTNQPMTQEMRTIFSTQL